MVNIFWANSIKVNKVNNTFITIWNWFFVSLLPSLSLCPSQPFPFLLFSAHFIINNEFNTIYQTNLWKSNRKIPPTAGDTKNLAPRLMMNNILKKYHPFTLTSLSANIRQKCAEIFHNLVIAPTILNASSPMESMNSISLNRPKMSSIEQRHANLLKKRVAVAMDFVVSFPIEQAENWQKRLNLRWWRRCWSVGRMKEASCRRCWGRSGNLWNDKFIYWIFFGAFQSN